MKNRWTYHKKHECVEKINSGVLTREQVLSIEKDLSMEELDMWIALEREFGPNALKQKNYANHRKYRRNMVDSFMIERNAFA